jgi:hypothetical protein
MLRDDVYVITSLRGAMQREKNSELSTCGELQNRRLGVKTAYLLSAIEDHKDAPHSAFGLWQS